MNCVLCGGKVALLKSYTVRNILWETTKDMENLKVVILAGGLGSRLSEETDVKPKPMVEIGGKPILWHIMQHYSSFGFNEFVLALGYRSEVIKRYILEYTKLIDNLTIKLRSG